MSEMPGERWGGVHAAALTLFDSREEVDWGLWRAYLQWLSESGLDGILIMGTTGEFPLLDVAERTRGLEVAAGAVSPSLKVIVNVGAMRTTSAVALAQRCAQVDSRRPDLLLAGPPYYYQSSLGEGQFLYHFRAIAEASEIPLLYYHIPKLTHFFPPRDLLWREATQRIFTGIKDSDGDVVFQRALRRWLPRAAFLYLSGNLKAVPESWAAEGDGAILGLAAAMPAECAALRRLWSEGDQQGFADLHGRLCTVWEVATRRGIAGARALLGLRNSEFRKAGGRQPFADVGQDAGCQIEIALREGGF